MDHFAIARNLLKEFKGDAYLFGNHVLKDVGRVCVGSSRAALVHSGFAGTEGYLHVIRDSIKRSGVNLVADIRGARPNAPREDLLRITDALRQANPDVIISFGGGSTIDATKAAEVLRTLGGEIDEYFGTGLVTRKLQARSTGILPVSGMGLGSPTHNSAWGVPFQPMNHRQDADATENHGRDAHATGLTPHVAIQTAAGSGAHLTKYSNITDLATGQKKLIVDEAIVPAHPVFDYTTTHNAPAALTADGAMDGLSHILEVFYGAVGQPRSIRPRRIPAVSTTGIVGSPLGAAPAQRAAARPASGAGHNSALGVPLPVAIQGQDAPDTHGRDAHATGAPKREEMRLGNPPHGQDARATRLREIAETGIALIVNYLPKAIHNLHDAAAREALCLATDLGAYAIMLGGTNGGHLTSFSLVDILTHGRACAVMNPYYTVFFAPAIQEPLRVVGEVFRAAGFISADLAALHGRELGVAVANGMFAFANAISFPTTLGEVNGFTQAHIDRALTAAKNPQLKMKLENMPIPLTVEMIDEYMGPILQAAATGDVALIRNV